MPRVTAYHRPATLDEATALLAEPGRVALAGGTGVLAELDAEPREVVDLQLLGLSGIAPDDSGRMRIGATATLQDVLDHEGVPELIRSQCRAEQPSSLRTLATIGGTVAEGDGDSTVVAALLVHDAQVSLGNGAVLALPELLATGVPAGMLIAHVSVAVDGVSAASHTGRTPADTPIVAAVGRRDGDDAVQIALTGVAAVPLLVDPRDPTANLDPPEDFRGSAEYRTELARVHVARVIAQVQS